MKVSGKVLRKMAVRAVRLSTDVILENFEEGTDFAFVRYPKVDTESEECVAERLRNETGRDLIEADILIESPNRPFRFVVINNASALCDDKDAKETSAVFWNGSMRSVIWGPQLVDKVPLSNVTEELALCTSCRVNEDKTLEIKCQSFDTTNQKVSGDTEDRDTVGTEEDSKNEIVLGADAESTDEGEKELAELSDWLPSAAGSGDMMKMIKKMNTAARVKDTVKVIRFANIVPRKILRSIIAPFLSRDTLEILRHAHIIS